MHTREAGNEFRHGVPSPLHIKQREIEASLADRLIVPARLSNPVKLVSEVWEYLTGKESASYQFKGALESRSGQLSIRVAPANVGRALRFMDTLIKLIQLRGHNVEVNSDKTYAMINGQKMEICFKERLKKVVVPTTFWSHTEFHPAGLLFQNGGLLWKRMDDGKLMVEDQLSKLFATLELSAENQKIRHQEQEKDVGSGKS